MQKQPLVSIIIPTFNRAHLIGETLDSVLAQTYHNWECIIVDDGSTDNTDEVVGEYVKKDARFRYYHRPDEHMPGGNGARNYGFKMSKGEFVNWLDSDDLFSKNKIEKQVEFLINKQESISTCKWTKFKKSNDFELKNLSIFKDYKNAQNIFQDYGKYGFFPSHSFLIDRKILKKSSLWNEHLKINQDGEFFCRVIINSKSICFSKDSYVLYRTSTGNKTSEYSTYLKAKHAIISWKMIENHLLLADIDSKIYIDNAKFYQYKKLKNKYDELINNNYCFFKSQIKYFSFKQRLTRKVLSYFK